MYLVKNSNGVLVPVCDSCYNGHHNTRLWQSHFCDDPDRSDCKEVGNLNGKVVQCCCGMGNEKLERELTSLPDLTDDEVIGARHIRLSVFTETLNKYCARTMVSKDLARRKLDTVRPNDAPSGSFHVVEKPDGNFVLMPKELKGRS